MNKTQLRKKYKALRNAFSPEVIEEKSLTIANNLLSLPIWDKTYYHLFLSIIEQKEVNTEYILQILFGKNKEVVLSKTHFPEIGMSHFLLTENTIIKKSNFNVPEPIDGIEVPVNKIDIVFVPLLAYDKTGNRVGYGKGYYDVFLAKCKPETIKIGLSFFPPEEIIFDTNPTDIKLDYCVTPAMVYSFGSSSFL